MTVDASLEQPRPISDAASSDAITFAFGDHDAGVYGVARLGLSGAPATASGLVVLFAPGADPVVRAAGGEPTAGMDWSTVAAAGVTTTIDTALEAWTLTLAPEDGSAAQLTFRAISEPSWMDAESPAGTLGGMEGYEQICAVEGSVTVAEQTTAVDGLGQRGHSWGAPSWDRITRARTLNAWTEGGSAVSLVAIAPEDRKARNHDREAIGAVLFTARAEDEDGTEPLIAHDVPEPLLSTAYDEDGRQRRAGIELSFEPDGPAHRGAGEVVCGTTIDLGRLRLDCAFMEWRMDGHRGIARYDVLRRT